MKKLTPQEKMLLKKDGYTDREIREMEMEMDPEDEIEVEVEIEDGEDDVEERELPTNGENMRKIPWAKMRAAGNMKKKKGRMQ